VEERGNCYQPLCDKYIRIETKLDEFRLGGALSAAHHFNGQLKSLPTMGRDPRSNVLLRAECPATIKVLHDDEMMKVLITTDLRSLLSQKQ
jgi:hypothetical protein